MADTRNTESTSRAYKAAALARTAVEAGIAEGSCSVLSNPGVRTLLLQATPRGRTSRRRGEPFWTEASEQTWAEVVVIVKALTAVRS